MEQNLYHLTPGGARSGCGIEQLPETLGEAIEIAAESELVLRTLGEHIFNRFVEIKRAGVGGLPRPGHSLGARALPADPVERSDRQPTGRLGPVSRRPKGSSTAADYILDGGKARDSPPRGQRGYPSITGSSASARPRACCGAPASARGPARPRSSRGASTSGRGSLADAAEGQGAADGAGPGRRRRPAARPVRRLGPRPAVVARPDGPHQPAAGRADGADLARLVRDRRRRTPSSC